MEKIIDVDAGKVVKMLDGLEIEKSIPKKERKKILRASANPIKRSVRQGAAEAIPSDPRKARQAVKSFVYKDGMGTSINILPRKKSGSGKIYRSSVVRTGGVSGIKRKRYKSKRTAQIESYWGADRAFILLFIERGTILRVTNETHSKAIKPSRRGSIFPRSFFRKSVDRSKASAETCLREQLEAKLKLTAKSLGAEVK